ncbi:glycosyltransferase [Winogradskyella sp. PE311]|uniref:glycosyltransferase n=1 Tax=Winogradskyella sp. PE311 TaxID=3366943 RepID=UPI0039814504
MAIRKKTLAIFTLVEHKQVDNHFYGYGPYIREMNIWVKNFDNILIVAPFTESEELNAIDLPYEHPNINLVKVTSFNIKSFVNVLSLLIKLPVIMIKIFRVMQKSDHLHFRCPSNIAALAAIAQVFFPSKSKTVKYAGNWSPDSRQPFGYRFQKWLLSNSFFTKNNKILVYGKWDNQSKYVVPFYTATFSELDKIDFSKREYSKKLKFIFLGALVKGKRPFLVIKIIEELIEKGINLELHMFGDGILEVELKNYISNNSLKDHIVLHGNKSMDIVKAYIKDSHFSILPSKSEGWPKALAEGMFYGVIPISTNVSCISWMLDNGNRGILIEPNQSRAAKVIIDELEKGNTYLNAMSQQAQKWSEGFTIERFQGDIKTILES